MSDKFTPTPEIIEAGRRFVKDYVPKRHDCRLSRKEVIDFLPFLISAIAPMIAEECAKICDVRYDCHGRTCAAAIRAKFSAP